MKELKRKALLDPPASSVPPLEQRLEAYESFLNSMASGSDRHSTVLEISVKFGLSQQTVYSWFKGESPLGRRGGRIQSSTHMPYMMGALLGDGCTYVWRKTYQVWLIGNYEFTSKFADKASRCLDTSASAYHYAKRNYWFVKINNAELHFLFKRIRSKLDCIVDLLNVGDCRSNRLGFIEGLFDAEGCVKIIRDQARTVPKICLDLTNTDLKLIVLTRTLFKEALGIDAKISWQRDKRSNRKVVYHLRVYRKSDVRTFLANISTVKMTADKLANTKKWLERKNWRGYATSAKPC